MTKHVSEGGGHQVTSDNVITWSQAGTIPAHGWHQILCTLRQRLRSKTSTGRSFITAAVQTDQAATTHSTDKLKIVVIRRRHILEVIIKSKTNTEEEFPSVSLNPNNPVLINSTIKFVCLNDRQDVEIRMLCGYWIVWEQDQVAGPDSIAILFVLSILCALRLRRILSIV